ncbi:MAG: helix-turn-helix transcriptional regulator [Ilumatobacteraceae bacterium]|nr:helix-turn-helix transcriptional regulator [Ilumatobacteraceae bacterium]
MHADDLDRALIRALSDRRVLAGMTQEQLADQVTELKMGVVWTRSHVAAVESGRRKGLRPAEIVALCVVHKIGIGDLLRQVGVADEYIAHVCRQTVDEVRLTGELDELRLRTQAARTALDPALPPPLPDRQ